MTVSAATTRADYTGNGVTVSFAAPFYFIDNSHIKVLKTNTNTGVATSLSLGSDYSLAGAGVPSGGTATLTVAPQTYEKLTVYRLVPYTQTYHYVAGDTFPAASHETNLDLLCMETQQLNEAVSRALSLPVQITGVSTVLPSPVANNVVGWNASATALQNVDPSTFLTIAGSSGFSYQTFTGDGSTVNFTLSANPGVIANTEVFVGGVAQTPATDYTVSGTALTFVSAPPSPSRIYVRWGTTLGVGVPSDTSVTRAKLDPSFAATVPDSTSVQAATSKATPVDADLIAAFDSAASFGLKKLTWANIKATLKTYLDTLYIGQTNAPVYVRQTVLSGPVDSSGFAAFGGTTGSTTVTASGTISVTAAQGASDRTGSSTNPSWTGLSTNGAMYLYVDVSSVGGCTTGSATLKPTYRWGGNDVVTNGQNTFNVQEMTMKVGNGSAASAVWRVFVGEVTVAGGVVSAITWYALLGRYESGLVATLPGASTAVSANHNIGTKLIDTPTAYLECITTDNGYAVGDRLTTWGGANGAYDDPQPIWWSEKSCGFGTNSATAFRAVPKGGGTGTTSLTAANWKYGFYITRGW